MAAAKFNFSSYFVEIDFACPVFFVKLNKQFFNCIFECLFVGFYFVNSHGSYVCVGCKVSTSRDPPHFLAVYCI